jgi:hypothetical protein
MKNRVYLHRFVIVLAILTLLSAGSIAVPSYLNSITPTGIVIHHSAVPLPLDGSPLDVRVIDEIHRKRGFSIFYWGQYYHVGYHYIILPDGTVQGGRPEHCQGAHTTGYNSFIGICLIGDFSTEDNPDGHSGPMRPTPAQMQSLIELITGLRQRYGIPLDKVIEHHSVNPNTECPGDQFNFQQLMEQLQARLSS